MDLSWLRDLGVGAVGGVLGGLIALAGDAVRRRWASVDARRGRRDERSEQAAELLRDVLGRAEELFSGHGWDDYPADAKIRGVTRAMRRYGGLIADPEVRRRIDLVIESLENAHAIMSEEGIRPYRIARTVCGVGRQTLEAMLREEKLPEATVLDEFHKTIDWHYAALEKAEQEYLEKQKSSV